VSEKYILACDSVTLLVKPKYYDFFTRSLEPLRHYWPVRSDDKCKSIKFAVDWGNNHKQKVSISNLHIFLFGKNYVRLANISIKLDAWAIYVGAIYRKSSE
jgi:hypothetical protein